MGQPILNSFDAVICMLAVFGGMFGYVTGLLRSLATILGYLGAAPVAIAATPLAARALAGPSGLQQIPHWGVFLIVLLVAGMLLANLLRTVVGVMVGSTISLPDRLAGAMLGVSRIALVAVALILVFDRIIPPQLEPAFLAQSRLRPYLAIAAAAGVKSLPPEVETYLARLRIDQALLSQ